MKSIAILLPGHSRSYTKTRTNIVEKLILPLQRGGYICDIYSSVWNNTGYRETGWGGEANLNKLKGDSVVFESEDSRQDEFVSKYYHARGSHFSPNYSGPETCGDAASMWYKIWRSFQLIQGHYDFVFRIRPDIFFEHEFDARLLCNVASDTIYMANWHGKYEEVTCRVMDHFAFGDLPSMKIYCNLYAEIDDIISRDTAAFSGEGLLYSHLTYHELNVERVPIHYGVMRSHGFEKVI